MSHSLPCFGSRKGRGDAPVPSPCILPVSYAGVNLVNQTWLRQADISKQVGQVREICEKKWFEEKQAVNSPAIAQRRPAIAGP